MTMMEQNTKVYIIEAVTGNVTKLSQEGYRTLNEAKNFITSRKFDTIMKINDFYYIVQDEELVVDYKIHEIIIK